MGRQREPYEYRLLVPADIDIVEAGLLAHAEDWHGIPRLRREDTSSANIRRFQVVMGARWEDRHGRELKNDTVVLANLRLVARPENRTDVSIRFASWSGHDYSPYLESEHQLTRYCGFLDQFAELLVTGYGAVGEKVVNPGRPSISRSFALGRTGPNVQRGDGDTTQGDLPAEAQRLPAEMLGRRFGTCRDLSGEDVLAICQRCRAFTRGGGKVTRFWEMQNFDETKVEPLTYTLETLRGWLKDPRFKGADP